MSLLDGQPRYAGDDGSADPGVAAALHAFAAGEGSEHAALRALSGSRLLVPVVAVRAGEMAGALTGADGSATAAAAVGAGKSSEIAIPKLVGQDGRTAILAFSCLQSLNSWRLGARPVPTAAAHLWRAAVEDSCAVVIDVAGPVPLAVEGARLAALAQGALAPLPQDDPDVRAAVALAVAELAPAAGFRLLDGGAAADLLVELDLHPAGNDYTSSGSAGSGSPGSGADSGRPAELAARVGAGVMARLGGRLRRGVGVTVRPPRR